MRIVLPAISKFRSVLARRHNIRAHFWQSLANYCQQAGGLVLGIILARLLTPENFGEFAYAGSVVGLFILPASWSLASQVVAEVNANPRIVNDALWVSRWICLARTLLAVGAVLFLGWSHGIRSALLGMVIVLPQIGGEFIAVLRAALEGRGQFKVNFYDSLMAMAFGAGIGLPAAWLGAGTWALVLPGIPFFLAQVALFTKCSGTSFFSLGSRSGKTYFQSGLSLWLANVSEGALTRADKFLLGKFSTMASLGDYNRASNYAPLSVRIMNSLITNATVSGLARAADGQARFRLLAKASALLFTGGLLNFSLFLWLSPYFVPWIFGSQWVSAIPVFQALAPLSLVLSFAYLPACVVLAKRRYALLAVVRIVGLIAFLGGALWIGHQLDAVKMAWLLQGAFVFQGGMLTIACLAQFTNYE